MPLRIFCLASSVLNNSEELFLVWIPMEGCTLTWMSKALVVVGLWSTLAGAQNLKDAPSSSATFKDEGDTSHLELVGQANWVYSTSREGNEYKIQVPTLDEMSRSRLTLWRDSRVLSVRVESTSFGRDEIVFQLASPEIDAFDYVTDQPSRLIVDFFRAEKQTKLKSESSTVAGPKVTGPKVASSKPPKTAAKKGTVNRAPAGGEVLSGVTTQPPAPLYPMVGLADGADPEFSRFAVKDYEVDERAIIRSHNNIYIRFPPLTLQDPTFESLKATPPVYEIQPQDSVENKRARLLLTLFQRGRTATFIKTLAMFRSEFPVSRYDQLLKHMEADSYYRLWDESRDDVSFQKAMAIMRGLVDEYPDSPLREYTWAFTGFAYLERRQFLPAIQVFEAFVRTLPQSQFSRRAQIALARSQHGQGRYKEAREIYNRLATDSSSGMDGIEATFRIGDTFLAEKSYDQALKAYEMATQRYPSQANSFPNAFYNLAESKFWLAENVTALNAYREFVRRFPKNPHGAFALTRIGELLDILGAPGTKSVGAFLESQFRFSGSPGANVARLRLLAKRMPASKPKDVEREQKELMEFAEKSDLQGIKDFASLMLADGYFERSELDRALKFLLAFYQNNTTSQNLDLFRDRIVRVIAEQVKQEAKDGDYISAFRTYGTHAGTWLKSSDRLDVLYYIGLAFERSGVPGEAAKLYRKVLNELIANKGTPKEKERGVFETLPSVPELQLRLAAVSLKQKDLSQTATYLGDIGPNESLPAEGQVEAIEIAAALEEARGNYTSAQNSIARLVSTWKGKPALLAPIQLRSARISIKLNDYAAAESTLDRLLNAANDLNVVSPQDHSQALELKANLFDRLGRSKEAIKTFTSLIEQYGDKPNFGASVFRLGELLKQQGDIKRAQATWAKLDRPETQYWHRMAQEEMRHDTWRADYKKYIERIPAMTDFEKSKATSTRGKNDSNP